MDIASEIREFIAKNLLFSNKGYTYDDDISFLEEGIVDSQGVMELVMFVEDNFKISVDDPDVTPDNFDSVTRLTDYVRRKLAVKV
jgi:acyl carrier protein